MSQLQEQPQARGLALVGTKAIALRLLERLAEADLAPSQVVTWDDSEDSRSRLGDLETFCSQHHIPFFIARRASDAYAALDRENTSVVFVAGWYRLIPDEVLNSIPNGFIGAHYSPLPKYRGSAPVVWQLINGEKEVGFSLFRLGPGMDEGDLAASGVVPAGDGYVGAVLDRLDSAALDKFVTIAPGLTAGTHTFAPQSPVQASYSSMRTPADGRLDWSRPAEKIVRLIRAQSRPYPGAWSMTDGTDVRIWRASVESSAVYYGVPGHVVRTINGAPVVACGGNGGVLLEEFDGAHLGLASRLG